MTVRDAALTTFLTSLFRAVDERGPVDGDARRVSARIERALEVAGPPGASEPVRLPVCTLLDDALENVVAKASDESAPRADAGLVEHAQALHALSPRLAWWRRPDTGSPGEPLADGHANATVIGPGGLEERDDAWIGISLMAPGLVYPEHHHPPEEVYLVSSRGRWWRRGEDWHEPGIGGLVYNPPGILHAMRSGPEPLLAVWCLPRRH